MIADQISLLVPAVLEIIGINILLSGDNAVVIALACRGLPASKRRLGVVLGAATAVLLRVVFTVLIADMMSYPWLRAAGALLLVWIAVNLLVPEEDEHASIAGQTSLWYAVRTVALADLVMSFDNVLAIAAAAKGDLTLIVLGLVLSVPLVTIGASLILKLIEWFPMLVWAGAALLGWIGGDLLASDSAFDTYMPAWLDDRYVAAAATALVLVCALLWRRAKGITGFGV